MPFGVTYAVYVATIAASAMFLKPGEDARQYDAPNGSWMVSLGEQVRDISRTGQVAVVDLEYRTEQEWFLGLKPGYGVAVAEDGSLWANMSLRKDFYVGKLRLTPFFGPALYQSDLGNFETDELIQFRTGFDISYETASNFQITGGFYHISNAMLTDMSAEVDVVRVGMRYEF